MKYIVHIFLILAVGIFIGSCEKDTNGRMPDGIKDSNVGVLVVTESDPFINVSAPADYEISLDVDLLFEGDFEKLDVVVVYNKDFSQQHVLTTVTSVPQSLTFDTEDLVEAIPVLTSVDDIAEGDAFDVFTNITLSDGQVIPGFLNSGVSTNSPSVHSIIGVLKEGTAALTISVPCAFDINDYLGVVNVSEYWAPDLFEYQIEVILDPDYTGDKIGLILVGVWDGTWELGIELDTYDYSIIGNPASQLMAPEVFGVYADPTWSVISGRVETCSQSLVVNIGRFCVSIGCFGGMPITYTTSPASKKSASDLRLNEVPQKTIRIVE